MKKDNNGFVLIETLIVVLLLTVTLMGLYSSFAYMINKTRERNNHDSIETLYKTYFVKDVIDSNYSTVASQTYPDSFLYYVKKTVPNNICDVIGYDGSRATRENADVRKIIICNYNGYESNPASINDPLRDAVVSYGIEKIYYLDFSAINTAEESTRLKLLNTYFDGSTIDYVVSQGKTQTGNVLIVKYSKKYNDVVKNRKGVKIEYEKYHSSIAATEVSKRTTALPIYLYSDPNVDFDVSSNQNAYRWNSYLNGTEIALPSNIFEDSGLANNSFSHYGQMLIGWTTDGSTTYTPTQFDSCKADTYSAIDNGTTIPSIECYDINNNDHPMKITDDNRKLYAVWCGDHTIGGENDSSSGVVECQARITTSGGNGVKIYDGVYRNGTTLNYIGDVSNNYVLYSHNLDSLIGKVCLRLIGNLGNSYYKAIFSGIYDGDSCSYVNSLSLGQTLKTYDAGWDAMKKWYEDSYSGATRVFDDSVVFCKRIDDEGNCADGSLNGVGYLYKSDIDQLNSQSLNTSKQNKYLISSNYWMTSPTSLDNNRYYYSYLGGVGAVAGTGTLAVRPVVSIKKSAKIVYGKGTRNNPYILTNR